MIFRNPNVYHLFWVLFLILLSYDSFLFLSNIFVAYFLNIFVLVFFG